jgi:hypothetical protein
VVSDVAKDHLQWLRNSKRLLGLLDAADEGTAIL